MSERVTNLLLAAVAGACGVALAYSGEMFVAIGLAGSCLFLANGE